jgi:RNA polymerase sigma-70 factor, ECF subfamily
MPTADHNARQVFEVLLEPVLDPAYRTAYHLTHSHEDAEELVQETALLAFRGFKHFQKGTNFRAWFLTILRNRFVSDYRKRQRRVETVDLEDAPELYLYTKASELGIDPEVSDPVSRLVGRLDAEQVSAALDQLPDEFREVAALYFTQDLSYLEIAGVLDIPVGTVRSRLHRARRNLQKALWNLATEYGVAPAESTTED